MTLTFVCYGLRHLICVFISFSIFVIMLAQDIIILAIELLKKTIK